ncbi:MAG: AMP-binding protein, partial [Spirochaetales bacterium]|nr:AMP-binding protein [Candidatus Physcosoma equi]
TKDLLPRYTKPNKVKQALAWVPKALLFPLKALLSSLAFSKVKEKLGKNFLLGVSGGGSFSESCETFFRAVGIHVVNGYGMTETSPVISLQLFSKPTKGTMKPLHCNTVEIRDENGVVLGPGKKGVLFVKGRNVMQGYYKKPEATAKIIGKDGYINTGDLCVMTEDGLITIVGRAKDTIVLSGGENVEPVPIEAALNDSPYIETAVVVGQDEKYLSALIVPNTKEIERYLKDNKVFYVARENLREMEEVKKLIDGEIRRLVNRETGFKSFEEINRFALLPKSFEVNVELSGKQELKRFKIAELYKEEIKSCYN